MADAPRVFLSYSHDSDEHAARVLALADTLRDLGIHVILDRYVHPAPDEGWPLWMDTRHDEADFVLMVCTETYLRRVLGQEEPGRARRAVGGADLQRIYYGQPRRSRFIPVLLLGAEPTHIPDPVRGHNQYQIATYDLDRPGFRGPVPSRFSI